VGLTTLPSHNFVGATLTGQFKGLDDNLLDSNFDENDRDTSLQVLIDSVNFKNLCALVLNKESRYFLALGNLSFESLVLQLHHQFMSKFYPYQLRFYLYGAIECCYEHFNPLLSTPSQMASIPEILAVIDDHDCTIIMRNYLMVQIGQQLGPFLYYVGKIRQADSSSRQEILCIKDSFTSRFVTNLAPNNLNEIKSSPAANYEVWQNNNLIFYKNLLTWVYNNKIELSELTHQLLHNEIGEVINYLAKEKFNRLWQKNFVPLWKVLSKLQRIRLIDKLNNREWAEIMAVNSDNLPIFQNYLSKGRYSYLKDEIDYIKMRGLNYEQAEKLLKKVIAVS
jgi:hypothetical protein